MEIQTKLARPDVRVVQSIEELAGQVLSWHGAGRREPNPEPEAALIGGNP